MANPVVVDSQTKQTFGAEPAKEAKTCTPSDTVPINCRALYVGVTGNISVVDISGNAPVTFMNVAVGFFPVSCKFVRATATTATNLIALF